MDAFYIGLYLLLQILLGVYLTRFIKSESDFFLGGRNLPTFAIAFSIFATWFGAETCIGSAGAVFKSGLSGSKAEPIGYGLCLLLTAIVIAPKIWNEKYITMGDFIKDRHSEMTEKIFIWIILPSSLIWAAAQIKAFGEVLSVATNFDVSTSINIATIFVILYTLLGGFLGDVITDVVQGAILAIGLVVIIYFTLSAPEIELSKIPSEKLNMLTPDKTFLERLDSWLIPILGSLMSQELVARVLSAKNAKQATKGAYAGTAMYLLIGTIPIILGLVGSQFDFQLQESEQFLPTLAKFVLPKWVYIIFAGALISAILSTIDSILLAISALVSHNFLVPILKIESPKKKLTMARIVLVVSALVAYVIAIYGDSVYEMVETASSFGTSGILVISIAGIFQKTKAPKLASITLLFGISLSVVLDLILELPAAFALNIFIVTIFYFLSKRFAPKNLIA
jgi:SSS family transporter